MSFSVIQAGSNLQFLDSSGVLTTLTLPTGVTLRTDVKPRFAIHKNYVILVNTPSIPLTIDGNGVVRPLCPPAPALGPTVAAGDTGTLSGTYGGVRYTFVVKDAQGVVIAESDYSPPSNTVTIANKMLQVNGIQTSDYTISSRRIYRTTTNGAVLFPWLDLDGNTLTTVEDDLSDAGLSILAAPELGNPPRLILAAEWRDRLWGVGDTTINDVNFARPDAFWAWPSTNSITIPNSGRDNFGIRSLIPRRDSLGIGRRDQIFQIVGYTPDDFQVLKLSENTGVESNESMVIYRDTAFWLWKDGVYQWDGEGLRNISDPNVSSWFNTDSYFNRDEFPNSFAIFDPVRLKYKLFLAAAGGTTINRWVEYDLNYKTWWGPHKTDAFTPTASFVLTDDADKSEPAIGSSSGFVFQEQSTYSDDGYAIDMDVDTVYYDCDMPDIEKYFGEMSIIGHVQAAGTMTITVRTGYIGSTVQASTISYDLTQGRQRLRRLGTGKMFQMNFRQAVAAQNVIIEGFEVPWTPIGRR